MEERPGKRSCIDVLRREYPPNRWSEIVRGRIFLWNKRRRRPPKNVDVEKRVKEMAVSGLRQANCQDQQFRREAFI